MSRLLLLGFLLALLAVGGWALMTQPLPAVRKRPPARRGDPARLDRDVRTLAGRHSPRDFTHPANLALAAEWIGGELKSAGAAVSVQEFTNSGETYRNVIGRFGPETSERIVVGAHYDTDGPYPGADDNASAVAGLLELARLLAGEPLTRRVELVAFALEEMPFFASAGMGSRVHARSLREANAGVRAMLSLEMLGSFSDEPGSQTFPLSALRLFYPDRGNFIAVVGRLRDADLVRRVKRSMRAASDLPVYSINAPRSLPGVDLSDHASFWDAGYPAVMVTDTAFYRNPRYHTAADTPDTLDYGRMAKVVEGVLRAVLDFAAH